MTAYAPIMKQPLSILIAALGGEGGGVLAEWLVETAFQAGYPAQSTSIPGVAQRTGATTYYVEIYPEQIATLAGRRPVLSLLPVPGCIDLVVASELLEAGRTIQSGMVSPERTVLVTSLSRTLTTVEKMALGDGRFDSERLLDAVRQYSRRLVAADMEAIARSAGTVMSAVLFGAIAASGVLPFKREQFEAVIESSGVGVEASLRGFASAWDEVNAASSGLASSIGGTSTAQVSAATETESATATKIGEPFPPAARDLIEFGYQRLLDYQDKAYADLYLRRLWRILAAERQSDAPEVHRHALTRETGRFLALWMAFDDIVRVADLKCRASRFARVRREVAAREGDIVRIVDYFKPGVGEFSALLPAAWAQRLAAWDRRRQARAKPSFALALHLRADGIVGFAALRLLASLRGLRRRGARYGQEQKMIERWLAAIEMAAGEDWLLAQEIALCGRLVKGYGATNERGKLNLLHILDHLITGGSFATPAERTAAIRQAREAALTDEGGKALDRALMEHGAPPRPVKAQPILWTRRPAKHAGRGV
jgi:indolepyruvate ferredoxin oxidoreductase beta subunit